MKPIHIDIIQEEKPDPDRLLNFICEMGRMLVQNGAEIYRVEGSIEHVAISFGYNDAEIFAIPSYISVTIQDGGVNHTKSVRIKGSAINLDRLERLNALSRKICAVPTTLEESEKELQSIATSETYSLLASYAAFGLVAMFFTLFFGGGFYDMLIALPSGIIVKYVCEYTSKQKTNLYFANVLGGASISLVPTIFATLMPSYFHLDKIIIGAIMLLVPGVAITNVMRDMLSGDLITAITKITEVLIVGIGIATGIAITLLAVQNGLPLLMNL